MAETSAPPRAARLVPLAFRAAGACALIAVLLFIVGVRAAAGIFGWLTLGMAVTGIVLSGIATSQPRNE